MRECNWLHVGVRCGSVRGLKRVGADLFYCRKHYPPVMLNRQWLYEMTKRRKIKYGA